MSEQPAPAVARPAVESARCVVLKVGTRVLAHDDGGIALSRLFAIIERAAALRATGRDVLLVSSGAVGLGRQALGLDRAPADLDVRQACAAVGQTRLMALYDQGFSRLGVVCGQVLLTQGDFAHRVRYLNLRSTLGQLLRRGVVPVINENDAVATEELQYTDGDARRVFGDNDRLSALVASKLDADLVVLLTDVDGVYDRAPGTPGARLLARVDDPAALELDGAASQLSRGGMRSKVEAALLAARGGCHAIIASGLDPEALPRVQRGDEEGPWFAARMRPGARRRWIAFAGAPEGQLTLDPGAVEALRSRGASLLAAGVRRIEGDFRQGAVVELVDESGRVNGRGVVHCSSDEARAWCAGTPPQGVRRHHALGHRDDLVLAEP